MYLLISFGRDDYYPKNTKFLHGIRNIEDFKECVSFKSSTNLSNLPDLNLHEIYSDFDPGLNSIGKIFTQLL